MTIDRPALSTVARLLLFATLIIVIDLEVQGIDLINDVIGAVMVIAGMVRLRKAAPEPSRYHPPLLVLAGVALVAAVAEQIDPENIVASALAWSGVIGAWLTARLLAEVFAAEDDDTFAAQWSASERLLLWLGVIPIIGLSIAGWFIGSVDAGIDPISVVLVVLGLLPLLHLLVSLYRTSLLAPQPGTDT